MRLWLTSALFVATAAGAQNAPIVIGHPLPPWSAGMLDIHQISTGRGNSALVILPDGTSLLVDAGAAGDGIPETDPHPDASRTPGAWIARYVKRHLPDSAHGLDYVLMTHFHGDHIGQLVTSSPLSPDGRYRLTGITEVGSLLPIHTLIDRGWPDYAYPVALGDSGMMNYKQFINAGRSRGMHAERFIAGSNTQIRLMRSQAQYPALEIRNIVANGEVWSGSGSSTRKLFPSLDSIPREDWPSENSCSLGIRIRYGAFAFFTGGDLTGIPDPGVPEWQNVEAGIADAVGAVDVHVVNQHGSMGEESETFQRVLASRVAIIPSWAPSHPAPDVLKRIMNSRFAPRDRLVFATDMRPSTRTVIGQRATALAAPPGHIVVRVEPGGTRYWVAVTSATNERDSIIAVRGPFESVSAAH